MIEDNVISYTSFKKEILNGDYDYDQVEMIIEGSKDFKFWKSYPGGWKTSGSSVPCYPIIISVLLSIDALSLNLIKIYLEEDLIDFKSVLLFSGKITEEFLIDNIDKIYIGGFMDYPTEFERNWKIPKDVKNRIINLKKLLESD